MSSATFSAVEQKVYLKVMASKKRAMTHSQIEAAIPGLPRKDLTTAINSILKQKLFTASKNNEGTLTFQGVDVAEAKKQSTLTEEQKYVLDIIGKAGNKGISKPSISNQISAEVVPKSLVFKSLEVLEKNNLIKTFKSVNAPTMPLYILSHLKPPEDIAGGIWFDESKEYDSMFVDSLRKVILSYVSKKTFPPKKGKDSISQLCPNPIYTISKTSSLPTPNDVLRYIQENKVTTAELSIKNVMEIARALELDGLIEVIKPVDGVSIEIAPDVDSDGEPVLKKLKKTKKARETEDDSDSDERERVDRKRKEKAKVVIHAKKRERKEAEKKRLKQERLRQKIAEKEKKKQKEKKRRKKEKLKKMREYADEDDSDELREVDEPKRKRKLSASSESSQSDSDDDSESDSVSDSDSDSDSDSESSIASDAIDEGSIAFKPRSTAALGNSTTINPFFSSDGRQTLIDLSDQAVVYRATNRLIIPLGHTQAPCGTCPQFNFCEEDGPVNPIGCTYYTDWLDGTSGGWTAEVKAEKLKQLEDIEKARRRAIAEANGDGDTFLGEQEYHDGYGGSDEGGL